MADYLGGSKADNIFINAHGGVLTSKYEDGTFADQTSGVNLGSTFLSGRALELYDQGNIDELNKFHNGAIDAIGALKSISGMINDGKNIIFGSCNTGFKNRFGQYVPQMNPNIDVFLLGDLFYIEYSTPSRQTNFVNFMSSAIRKEDFDIGISRFKSGKLIDSGFNIQINKTNGFSKR